MHAVSTGVRGRGVRVAPGRLRRGRGRRLHARLRSGADVRRPLAARRGRVHVTRPARDPVRRRPVRGRPPAVRVPRVAGSGRRGRTLSRTGGGCGWGRDDDRTRPGRSEGGGQREKTGEKRSAAEKTREEVAADYDSRVVALRVNTSATRATTTREPEEVHTIKSVVYGTQQ